MNAMWRRRSLVSAVAVTAFFVVALGAPALRAKAAQTPKEVAVTTDWRERWEKDILGDEHNRYCDKETGEEIGWLVGPFVDGFYYGYLATHDTRWIDRLIDWTDAWVRRGVKEPDGYIGWPKIDTTTATQGVAGQYADSMLGEAIGLRAAVRMADTILKTPALKAKYGTKAHEYIALSERNFEKWDRRGCWRELPTGGVWVAPEFGIDRQTGGWTAGYARRATDGFTLPDNKENLIALWIIALYDATGKPVYRERAEKWWKVMRARMKLREDGKYFVWDYWDPAGPWDYNADGSTRHWVGVHPNGGYYDVDVAGIAAAYAHHLVFTRKDIDRLIATNRDYMWNHQVEGAKFQRIDGEAPDARWKDSPGVLWSALLPYDATLKKVFEANFNPASWGGHATAPWYLALQSGNLQAGG